MRFALSVAVILIFIYQIEAKCKYPNGDKTPSRASCAKRPHELFINGGSPCQTTCKTLGHKCNIKTFAPVRACYCVKGYARNALGRCIRIRSKECQLIYRQANTPSPKSCAAKPNEKYINGGSPCQTTCKTLGHKCNIQTFAPVKACYCIKGYARNIFGRCIRIKSKECQSIYRQANTPSPKSCAAKPNEIYINGGSPCQTTCQTLGKKCNIQTFAPVKACYCVKGYARNIFGRCIRIKSKECQSIYKQANTTPKPSPKSCAAKPNEKYIDGGSPCQTTCKTLGRKCNIKTFAPVKACYCVKGYARNDFGRCILIKSKECQWIYKKENSKPPTPSPESCAAKPNEKYIDGGSPCQTTCRTLNNYCLIQTFAPVKDCYCVDGYARGDKGKCIPINSKECQQLCGKSKPPSVESCALKPNEEYIKGGSPCQTKCSTLNEACNIRTALPVNACYCKNGYARNAKGKCIPINSKKCQKLCGKSKPPSVESCALKPNEEYIKGGSACQPKCSTLNQACNIRTFAPVNACYCKNGYARNTKGACIEINSDECQEICGERNQSS